uniref:Brix domain-containing protein n=1 Tax=Romanomermis culicivorax TaxID=13658 RepID=A0A915J1I9_ROMCU
MAKTQKSADSSAPLKITKKSMGLSKTEKGKKLRLEKNKAKRKRQDERRKKREALGERAPAKEVPRTIENTREYDVTMVDPNDEEIAHLEMNDEMATYFKRETTPKVLITISQCAKMKTWKFCYELKRCIPNSEMFSRKYVSMKKLVKQALEKKFTDIIIVNENRRKPSELTLYLR